MIIIVPGWRVTKKDQETGYLVVEGIVDRPEIK